MGFRSNATGITFLFVVVPFTILLAVAYIAAVAAVIAASKRPFNSELILAMVLTTLVWVGAAAFDYYKTFRIVTKDCPYL